MAQCRTCQAEIVWGMTQTGKRVPLNYPPEKRFVRMNEDEEEFYVADTYVSHFATCPQANEHRKKTPPQPGSTEDYRGDHDDG